MDWIIYKSIKSLESLRLHNNNFVSCFPFGFFLYRCWVKVKNLEKVPIYTMILKIQLLYYLIIRQSGCPTISVTHPLFYFYTSSSIFIPASPLSSSCSLLIFSANLVFFCVFNFSSIVDIGTALKLSTRLSAWATIFCSKVIGM